MLLKYHNTTIVISVGPSEKILRSIQWLSTVRFHRVVVSWLYSSITLVLHHRLRAEGKPISSDPRPSPAAGGNRFPPLDHRGPVILNLRLLLWHRGMSPLRLWNTHTNTHTHTHKHTNSGCTHTHTHTHRGRFLTPTKQGNTFLRERKREREERGLLRLRPPVWCLKVTGWLLVISVKASGSLDFYDL